MPADLVGRDRARGAAPGSRAEQRRDLLLALLGLERAGAIDQRAAGLDQRRRRGRAAGAAAPASCARSASLLSQAMSGWRRIVPVDEQGASSSTASNGPPCHSVASAATISACRPSRARFSRSARRAALAERSTAVTCAPAARAARSCRRARRRGRRPCLPRDVAEQPRRQRGGGVLHPPGAFVVAGQPRHRPVRDGAHACRSAARGRAGAAAQLAASALHREIERRLVAVRGGDGARGVLAVVRASSAAISQSGVSSGTASSVGEQRRAVARDAAQHRVDQAGIARGAPVRLHQPHATDRPRRGPARRGTGSARRRSAARSRPAARRSGSPRSRNSPSRCRSVPSRRSTVATSMRTSARSRSASAGRPGCARAVELRVERALAAQHAVEDVGGDAARGETGHFGVGAARRAAGVMKVRYARRPADDAPTPPNHFRHSNGAERDGSASRDVQPHGPRRGRRRPTDRCAGAVRRRGLRRGAGRA